MENGSGTMKVEMSICSDFQKWKEGICYYILTKDYRLDKQRDRLPYRFCDDFEREQATTKRERGFIKTKLGEIHLHSFCFQATLVLTMGYLLTDGMWILTRPQKRSF